MPVEFGVPIPTREAIMSGRPETGPSLAMAERAEAAIRSSRGRATSPSP